MRRTTVSPLSSTGSLALLGAMLLALIVLGLGASANKAEAATTLTKSFGNEGSISIPSGAVLNSCSSGPTQGVATPYPSHISVNRDNGFSRGSRVLDVNVTLEHFSHTFPDDVDVLLVHGTRSRTIMSDVGGSTDVTNIALTLDDEAGFNKFLPTAGPLATGRFQPTNDNLTATDTFPAPAPAKDPTPSLSGFDGMKANGGWDLFVVDDSGEDCGSIFGWHITITARR